MAKFDWVEIYEELADKLLEYKNNRKELFHKLEKVLDNKSIEAFKKHYGGVFGDIDPFTVFSTANRFGTEKRTKMFELFKSAFKLESVIPASFDGVPMPNAQNYWYFGETDNKGKDDMNNLWEFFSESIGLTVGNGTNFNNLFLKMVKTKKIKWTSIGKLTMGLFWIRPKFFLSLDSKNISNIKKENILDGTELEKEIKDEKGNINLDKIDGERYLKLCEICRNYVRKKYPETEEGMEFCVFSAMSDVNSQEKGKQEKIEKQKKEEVEKSKNAENVYSRTDGIEENVVSEKELVEKIYIDDENIERLKNLLKRKKNVILTGAPGVGKTFLAKKIPALLTGKEASDNVEFIQFHQNYGYEDFVEGFKPNKEGGFDKADGIFKKFCNKITPDKDYFFIIDEINRGNLSKIFGELLMLIENDKREDKIQLMYSKEEFSVPKNLYIIGMMNTADRSITSVDYALRRRFGFFNLSPAFENEKFKKVIEEKKNEKLNQVIYKIKETNKEIRKDLGDGFQIGHSYFCKVDAEKELKDIIDFEICPLIDEYYFDSEDKAERFKKDLRGIFDAN
ncbi:MAG: AAA family ATPase [Clostridia bacterium]|nr:AAA family ATPase [Clostridia bacterium]